MSAPVSTIAERGLVESPSPGVPKRTSSTGTGGRNLLLYSNFTLLSFRCSVSDTRCLPPVLPPPAGAGLSFGHIAPVPSCTFLPGLHRDLPIAGHALPPTRRETSVSVRDASDDRL